ncbi:MAG: XRE family transcriptional regulator [Anaerolineae bacterium]|nr:XRE family transcriptional regulator [Anaerolineae bacterium]
MLGSRLKQARLVAGMTQTQLAQQLSALGYSITKAALSKYELEKSTPPASLLLLVGQLLKVNPDYFTFTGVKEVKWDAFRRTQKLNSTRQEMIKAYAQDVIALQLELRSLLQHPQGTMLPQPTCVQTLEDVEQAALNLRQHWGLEDQPIASLIQTAEDHQVIVVGWDADQGHFDGLCGWVDQETPVTVINLKVSVDRRRMTLAHELGHLVMDTSGLPPKESEKFAHYFGGALIVPKERVFHELGGHRHQLDWDELKILKRKYGLSMAAWVYRAKDLGIINEAHFKFLNMQLRQQGWHKQEPVSFSGEETPLQLSQMAHRAFAEGLINSDRLKIVYRGWQDPEGIIETSDHLTVYDLMAMSPEERERVMSQAFAAAAEDDFETFEANELVDFDDEE